MPLERARMHICVDPDARQHAEENRTHTHTHTEHVGRLGNRCQQENTEPGVGLLGKMRVEGRGLFVLSTGDFAHIPGYRNL